MSKITIKDKIRCFSERGIKVDTSNIYRFNGVDPFDNWTIKDSALYGYYPRNSLINLLSASSGPTPKDGVLVIPTNVKSIKGSCFRKSNTLKKIYIPQSVIYISEKAFLDCKATLYVQQGTYAEKYAKSKGLKYKEKS